VGSVIKRKGDWLAGVRPEKKRGKGGNRTSRFSSPGRTIRRDGSKKTGPGTGHGGKRETLSPTSIQSGGHKQGKDIGMGSPKKRGYLIEVLKRL